MVYNVRNAAWVMRVLGVIAVLHASHAGAQGGNLVAVLPVESESIDSVTAEVIDTAVADEVGKMGYTTVDKAAVAEARPNACLSVSCSETVDFIELGKNLKADVVLHTTVKKTGEELTVALASYDVGSAAVKAASRSVKASGLLLAVKELVGEVVTEAGPPPTPPQPAPQPAPLQPEPPAPAPVEQPQTQPEKPAGGLTPPGQEGQVTPPPGGEEKAEKKEEKKKGKPDQKGRVPLIITSGLLATGLGVGILLAADVKDWRIYLPVALLGGAGGVVISLVSTMKFKVTKGDAAMYSAIIAWSVVNGILIPGAAGSRDVTRYGLGGTLGGVVGLAGGITVAALLDPYPGDALLLSIAGLWGAAYAEMITGLVQPDDGYKYFIAGLVGLDIGLLAGGLLSGWLDVSPLRSGVITAVGLGGAALGALAGCAFVVDNPGKKDWRIFTGILLAGTTLGLIGGVFISSIVEQKAAAKKKKKEEEKEGQGGAQAMMPFLVYHGEGGWGMGVPTVVPVTVGRSFGFHTSLLGGVF